MGILFQGHSLLFSLDHNDWYWINNLLKSIVILFLFNSDNFLPMAVIII